MLTMNEMSAAVPSEKKISIFSFFSGSGFLDLGFETNGFSIDFVNEFSESFIGAYRYSREKMKIAAPRFGYWQTDVNEYLGPRKKELQSYIQDARKKSKLIGFIGGPPCPDFSIAGKNKGEKGDNGKLSLSYINLIVSMQPDFFLFENVRGLWKTKKHRAFFNRLKKKLSKAGYALTNRLTNALEFGVPQDRDRIFLVGIKKDILHSNKIEDFPWLSFAKFNLSDVKAMPWPTASPFVADSKTACPAGIPAELTVEYWFEKNDVENHPNSKNYFQPRNGLKRMTSILEGDDSRKSYKRLNRWRYSPTVAYGNNEVHLHPYKARRLSIAEAMALQSLPKEFCLPQTMTLSAMFKTVGNGVPYLLASGIAKTLYNYLWNLDYVKGNCSEPRS